MDEKCLYCSWYRWVGGTPECFKFGQFKKVNESCSEFDRLEVAIMGGEQKRKGWTDQKRMRKMIGLPLTKQLVYYPDRRKGGTKKVICALVDERYKSCYRLEVLLETKEIVKINSLHFAQMQNPSFVKDMEEQDKEAGKWTTIY